MRLVLYQPSLDNEYTLVSKYQKMENRIPKKKVRIQWFFVYGPEKMMNWYLILEHTDLTETFGTDKIS